MSIRLKPYPEYRDSGAVWLGEVPAHWEVARLKRLVNNVADQVSTKKPEDIYVALENVESWTGRIKLPKDEVEFTSAVKRFEPSDILFGKLRPYLAKVTRPRVAGVCVGEFLVLRSLGNVCPQFLERLLRSAAFINLVDSSTFGSKMPRAEWPFVGNIELAMPPHQEQKEITCFLGRFENHINRVVSTKRRLIGLLNEQKQGIVQQAVTRGLDRSVQLRPSGIDWLGDVPSHWGILQSGRLFREVVDTGHPDCELLSIDHFRGIVRQAEVGRKARASEDRSAYKLVRRGELAYNLMNAFMGSIGVSPVEGILSPAYAVARPQRPMDARYFHNLFRTPLYMKEFDRQSYGIMYERNRLYFDRFKAIPALVPPLDEQHEIAEVLQEQHGHVDAAIRAVLVGIDVLREYRTRLIADVVTGKLDVRGMMLPVSEVGESGEPELAEEDGP